MSMSFLTVLLVVFAGFLALLGVLALAVTKAVNPDGRTARGFFGGCASALALLFLCGVGATGLGIFVGATAVGTAIDKNPIEKIEIRRGPPELPSDDTVAQDWRHGPVHLLFTVRGNAGDELVEMVREVVEVDHHEFDQYVTIHDRIGSDGAPFQIVEFRLPLTDEDLEEIKREIERELDGLRIRLPESVAIHFESAERFY